MPVNLGIKNPEKVIGNREDQSVLGRVGTPSLEFEKPIIALVGSAHTTVIAF